MLSHIVMTLSRMYDPHINPFCFNLMIYGKIRLICRVSAIVKILQKVFKIVIGFHLVIKFGYLALGMNLMMPWLILAPRN
jgi:hypothetical protein